MSKSDLEKAIKTQKKNKEKLFIPYIMAGDGGLAKLKEQIEFLEKSGVTAIELGIPFSDPVADGPMIQASGLRALNAQISLRSVLNFLEETKNSRSVPIILMTYLNPVFQFGIQAFAEACKKSKVSGVIIPDLPIEEEGMISKDLEEAQIAFIRLAALTSSKERLKEIALKSDAFLYAVAVAGTTGALTQHEERVNDYLRFLSEISPVPVLAGFGISSTEQVKEMNQLCDGVIVGSAIVKALYENDYAFITELIEAKQA